jgi:tetratricopeptide (TPR) repeat protein
VNRQLFKPIFFLCLFFWYSCKHKHIVSHDILEIVTEFHLKDPDTSRLAGEGLEYIKEKDYANAIECFANADKITPDNPAILNALGNAESMDGQTDEAAAVFAKALHADPDFIETYVNYGQCLNLMRKYNKVGDILLEGISKKPKRLLDHAGLFMNLADSYHQQQLDSIALILLDSAKYGLTEGDVYDRIMHYEKLIRFNNGLPE